MNMDNELRSIALTIAGTILIIGGTLFYTISTSTPTTVASDPLPKTPPPEEQLMGEVVAAPPGSGGGVGIGL